jgi:hypothetical protein
MDNLDRIDPGLFGLWPERRVYGDGPSSAGVADAPEVKSGEGGDDLRRLLNDMTREMRAQFDYFRRLRGESDADGAASRADAKAAVDAMSLIVRTLEKIDALQRQLARDREEEADRHADPAELERARDALLALIDERADERAARLADERDGGHSPAGAAADGGGERREIEVGEVRGSRDGGTDQVPGAGTC